MKILKYSTLLLITLLFATSCNNDDEGNPNIPDPGPDFTGTFAQVDQMGRPAINSALLRFDDGANKDAFNVTIPSERVPIFQPLFLEEAVRLYGAYGAQYENNILGQDAVQLTTFLAADVLQVAPDAPTTYFDGTNLLTGRRLTDDVIDISLILIFGGQNGDRFNGQDLDGDGNADLPILVSDGVDASGETPLASFPYLEPPHAS